MNSDAGKATSESAGSLRLAVDIGGTFTDLAAFDETGALLHFGKALSTHDALVDGIQATMAGSGIAFKDAYLFLHGSTIAINTLLERTGAQTALLITEGFRDVYEIGRVNRPDAYNLFFSKHTPLVERALRFEVPERLRADGEEVIPLNEIRVREIAEQLKERGIDAIAVLLLHSYRNAANERRVKELLQETLPNVFVTASHELSQEYREFERVSTTAANAYIGPRVSQYLGELEEHLESNGFDGTFYAVQSTGGLFPVEHARSHCVRILESGPAAGVIGAQALCAQIGMKDAIAFDMGGTTAKAGVIHDGKPLTTGSALIGGYEKALPIQIPMIDIFEAGTGGGSIAHLVEGRGLRVGPQSAGSMPGPASYDRGGIEATVTDANLLLGRLDPDHFLGGEMALNIDAAHDAMDRIGQPLGLDTTHAADGIVQIAVTAMAHVVRAVTTDRGLDAGKFALIVYGGAGPLHASAIAREIGITNVIIPFSPGHFSAYGMLFSDLRYDYVRSCFHRLAEVEFSELSEMWDGMEREGRNAIAQSSIKPDGIEIEYAADMRYVGQEHAVTVDLLATDIRDRDRGAIKSRFDEIHAVRYGTSAPGEPSEIVSLRMTVTGKMIKPPRQAVSEMASNVANAINRKKPVYFRSAGEQTETPVYTRRMLEAGQSFDGPALVEEHASTTLLQPGDSLRVDEFGNLHLTIGGER